MNMKIFIGMSLYLRLLADVIPAGFLELRSETATIAIVSSAMFRCDVVQYFAMYNCF